MTRRVDARAARAACSWLVDPGSPALAQMIAEHGPVDVADALIAGRAGGLVPLRPRVERLTPAERWQQITGMLDTATGCGIRGVIPEDDEWPPQADDLTAQTGGAGAAGPVVAPLCLWVRGNRPVRTVLTGAVTVTGARACSAYGEHVATHLGHDLASGGRAVASGCGLGIDAAAHRGALAADGITVAVTACGLDRPYPVAHAPLLDRIAERGLLISAYPPGSRPERARFGYTRLLMAALASATVLVEAALRSSSLEIVRHALWLGRPALVVPGPTTSALSAGCHQVLRDHRACRLVTGADDVLDEITAVLDAEHRP